MSNNIFSYTKRDYENSRKEGISKIPILSKGNWTDLNATDPGIIILDYVHALVDMINYYQDHQALESFITTAKERANIFRLAKQLSYEIISAKGATCIVTFTSKLLFDSAIKIPKYTKLSTLTGIPYLTSEDTFLLSGSNIVDVPCKQGTLQEITYTGTGISRFSNVVGAKNQSVHLMVQNIDTKSVRILDDLGSEWTEVPYISYAGENEKVYQVELNPDDTVTIYFGDGERGYVPKTTDTLTVTYINNLAGGGKVSAGTLISLDSPVYDSKGRYVDFTVSNHLASIGGSSSQSSREIRERAPGIIKAQDRAVTLSDFENLAKLIDGVKTAKAYDINNNPDLCLHHEVKVLISPEDAEIPVEVLKNQVYSYLSSRMIPPTNLQIITPNITYIDLEVTVKKLDSITEGRLSYNIQEAIDSYFEEGLSDIGISFYPADLSARLSTIEGVRYIIAISPSTIVNGSEFSIIKLGKLSIIVQ